MKSPQTSRCRRTTESTALQRQFFLKKTTPREIEPRTKMLLTLFCSSGLQPASSIFLSHHSSSSLQHQPSKQDLESLVTIRLHTLSLSVFLYYLSSPSCPLIVMSHHLYKGKEKLWIASSENGRSFAHTCLSSTSSILKVRQMGRKIQASAPPNQPTEHIVPSLVSHVTTRENPVYTSYAKVLNIINSNDIIFHANIESNKCKIVRLRSINKGAYWVKIGPFI